MPDSFLVLAASKANESHEMVGLGMFGIVGQHEGQGTDGFGRLSIFVKIDGHLIVCIDLFLDFSLLFGFGARKK